MTTPQQFNDPFADPAIPPSTYPSVESLRGRLVMITPRSIEQRPSQQNPQVMVDRITGDVSVVDGLGPVPVFKQHQATGQMLDGPDFTGMYLSGSRVVDQLRSFVGTGRAVLGVIDTRNPGTMAGLGNPWGITAATEEQKAQARAYLANRSVAQAAPPAPAPVQQTYPQNAAPAPLPVTVPSPVAVSAPTIPQPGSAPVGANPFA